MAYYKIITSSGMNALTSATANSENNLILDNLVLSEVKPNIDINDIKAIDIKKGLNFPVNQVSQDSNGYTATSIINNGSSIKVMLMGIIGHTSIDPVETLIAIAISDGDAPIFTLSPSQIGDYKVTFTVDYNQDANVIINSENVPIANMNDITNAINIAIGNYNIKSLLGSYADKDSLSAVSNSTNTLASSLSAVSNSTNSLSNSLSAISNSTSALANSFVTESNSITMISNSVNTVNSSTSSLSNSLSSFYIQASSTINSNFSIASSSISANSSNISSLSIANSTNSSNMIATQNEVNSMSNAINNIPKFSPTVLPNGTDLNTITTFGYYILPVGNSYNNFPSDLDSGRSSWMFVISDSSGNVYQEVTCAGHGAIDKRHYSTNMNNGFTNWTGWMES